MFELEDHPEEVNEFVVFPGHPRAIMEIKDDPKGRNFEEASPKDV